MITDGEALWEMGSIIIPFILGIWLGMKIKKWETKNEKD